MVGRELAIREVKGELLCGLSKEILVYLLVMIVLR